MPKKALLIVNFYSGKGRAKTELSDIVDVLSKGGFLCTVYLTKNKAATIFTASEACKEYDVVVAVGGDGTLSEVVNGVMAGEKNIPVGYIPAGSTNDLAKSLGIPVNLRDAAEAITAFSPRRYDIGKFNDRFFTYIAATGAFTKVSYATSQSLKNALGHLAYVMEGIKSVSEIQKMRITGTTDQGSFDGEYLFCSISNSISVGGLIQLDRGLVLFNDGLFELCLIAAPKTGQEMMELVGDIMQSDFDNPLVTLKKISRGEFTIPASAAWTLDGEDGGQQRTVSFSIPKRKLMLLTGTR